MTPSIAWPVPWSFAPGITLAGGGRGTEYKPKSECFCDESMTDMGCIT